MVLQEQYAMRKVGLSSRRFFTVAETGGGNSGMTEPFLEFP